MSVETSLKYQQNFFDHFASAWADQSTFRIYQGIDDTAANLRLDAHDVPGYILAYDKQAEQELMDFLQSGLVSWLREHVPFFDVTDDGRVFFGDWYHRRQFGRLDVINRTILHQTDEQRTIMPQLSSFADHQATYLDDQLEDMRRQVYQNATDLHNQLEMLEADQAGESEASTGGRVASNAASSGATGSGLRGLLRNFIDPDEDGDDDEPAPARPARQPQRRGNGLDINRVRRQFDQAKAEADKEFDSQKRQLQVAAAVTNYEYQALTKQYDTVADFANVLTNMPDDYMQALKAREGGRHDA
ncbi:SbcC family exonuclease [Lacticaseibacillus pantheris]